MCVCVCEPFDSSAFPSIVIFSHWLSRGSGTFPPPPRFVSHLRKKCSVEGRPLSHDIHGGRKSSSSLTHKLPFNAAPPCRHDDSLQLLPPSS